LSAGKHLTANTATSADQNVIQVKAFSKQM